MTIVVVGYIKDFKLPCSIKDDDVKVIEGVSERIDYIRSNNLEQKESFTLIPKFVTDITDSGKQIMIFIKKIDILTNLRKKRKVLDFGQVQSSPFYDSRQILVTTQKLKDLFPIDILVINWGSKSDIISYLKSADSQIYDIQTIFINKTLQDEDLTKFLNDHHFILDESEDVNYINFKNNKPNIKSLIFNEPDHILDYIDLHESNSIDSDIIAINWNNHMHLPFDKFFPCKSSTIYFDKKSYTERIKNTILFGNKTTMIQLAKLLKDKRIIFLDSLRSKGFNLTSFN